MSKSRIALLATLAAVLALVAGLQIRQYANQRRLAENFRQNQALLTRVLNRSHGISERQFTDGPDRGTPGAYSPPASDWITGEQQFYERLLAGKHYDVLVAPFQVDGDGFDRATRLLMTEELGSAIERAGLGKVADPYVIWKVFGAGRRIIDVNEIYRVANLVGARRVVWSAVGQERAKTMHLTVLTQELKVGQPQAGPAVPTSVNKLGDIAIGADSPPIEAFEAHLPALLSFVGTRNASASSPDQIAEVGSGKLSTTPLTFLTQDSNPARDACAYSLLYLLTPARIESTREYFAVRAYLATMRLTVASADYRVLRARALLMLGYRPAALKALGNPQTGEEQELLAVLNGNLPQVRDWAAKAQKPLIRLIEQLDVTVMAQDYGVLTSQAALEDFKRLDLPGQEWPFLAARAATDGDPWSQFDNASLKALLDHEFPDQGYSLQDLVSGQVAQGDEQKLRSALELSPFNHVRHILSGSAGKWCCDMPSSGPRPADYLVLLAAIGDDNLIRRVNFEALVQGAPTEALRDADAMQSVYRGNPYYSLARARAEQGAARATAGAERAGLLKSAYEDALNAMYWEQGQSAIASEALNEVGAVANANYGFVDNFYAMDLPHHPLYELWAGGGDSGVMHTIGLAALDNATSQFGAVTELADVRGAPSDNAAWTADIVKQLQGRFIGDPARNIFLADQQLALGHEEDALLLLRENIHDYPQHRESYLKLGAVQFNLGQPREGAETFRSFPGLKTDSPLSAVDRSNVAYDMEGPPYAAGDFELAIPFLRIAASQHSGSQAELEAGTRLQLLEGDISGAMGSTLDRAQRYNDARAYRDYLAMLHAEKHTAEAWSAFNALAPQLDTLTLWQSALVGHHIGGTTEEQVSEWVQQGNLQPLGNEVGLAVTYLVMFATTDRLPSQQLSSLIERLDRPVWQFEDGAKSVVRPDAGDPLQHILGPATAMTPHAVLPLGFFGDPHKHRVRPPMSFYVQGYRALKVGDFKASNAAFTDASTLYDLSDAQSRYMLSYFALAAEKSGAGLSLVESILGRFSPADRGFDYMLTSAVIDALEGKSVKAMKSLKLARYLRTHVVDNRPALTQYTYGDICELLYEETHEVKYRDEALDWARSRERAEPWYSWSFALEAALAPDPADRQRALAMLEYLDPGSRYLASFKKTDVDEALKRFAGINGFKSQSARTTKGMSL